MFYAVRYFYPTRVPSQRQLPTDHDCAVPTRGYQSDQPSHLPLVSSQALLLSALQRSFTKWWYVSLDKIAPYQKQTQHRERESGKRVFAFFHFSAPRRGCGNVEIAVFAISKGYGRREKLPLVFHRVHGPSF